MLSHVEKSIRDERKSEFPRVVNMLEKIRRAEFSNREFAFVMPSSGLCRVKLANGCGARVPSFFARHNQRVFRKVSSRSSAWKRGAAWPAGASF